DECATEAAVHRSPVFQFADQTLLSRDAGTADSIDSEILGVGELLHADETRKQVGPTSDLADPHAAHRFRISYRSTGRLPHNAVPLDEIVPDSEYAGLGKSLRRRLLYDTGH